MKKLLKWVGIIVGVFLLLIILGIALLPFVFPLEKIKEFAVAKISENIKRDVKIEKVSFDLFSGIKLKGIYIGNRAGFAQKPFVAAEALELRYAFWPLFSRQILIKEIRLVKPEILVEKNARGEFNFSDLTQAKGAQNTEHGKQSTGKEAKPPFDLFISSFSVKEGKIVYADHSTKTTNEIRNLNLKVAGFELALVKPIDLSISANVLYQGKEIPLSLTGQIGTNMVKETINISSLSLSIAGESISTSATISGWKSAPKINFSLSSKKINIDPLLVIFAAPAKIEAPKSRPGELTKAVNSATAAIPSAVSINGKIRIDDLSFQKFKFDKLDLDLALSDKKTTLDIKEIRFYEGALSGKASVDLRTSGLGYNLQNIKLTGFNSTPFVNTLVETFLTTLPDHKNLLNKVYGKLDLSLSLKGQGVEPEAILANAVGESSLSLKGGELKRLKTLAEIGKVLRSNTMQEDIKIKDLRTAFSIKNRIVETKGLRLEDQNLNVFFVGGVDLGKLVWAPGNRLTLKLSPALSKDVPGEFIVFRDDQGWLELTFELVGDLKKPIPKPILEKPLEKVIGKLKVQIEAQKIEIERSASTKFEEEKKRLEEEAKDKLKNLIKF